MVKAGIIDPVKVIRTALTDAARSATKTSLRCSMWFRSWYVSASVHLTWPVSAVQCLFVIDNHRSSYYWASEGWRSSIFSWWYGRHGGHGGHGLLKNQSQSYTSSFHPVIELLSGLQNGVRMIATLQSPGLPGILRWVARQDLTFRAVVEKLVTTAWRSCRCSWVAVKEENFVKSQLIIFLKRGFALVLIRWSITG
jgi:hypothetical protein